MTPQQRDATIQHFSELFHYPANSPVKNPGVTVFLISLKAGGVALVSHSFDFADIRTLQKPAPCS